MKRRAWAEDRKITTGARWTPERCRLARQAYEAGASLVEVAAEMRTSAHRVRDAVKSAGGTLRRRGARTEQNYFWRGGRIVDEQGYVLLKMNGHLDANASGYVREHRLVMSQMIGRDLRPEEVVHHRNGVRGDNRPENLELFDSNASHLAHELAGRCPKWTESGLARMRAASDRKRKLPSPSELPSKPDGSES